MTVNLKEQADALVFPTKIGLSTVGAYAWAMHRDGGMRMIAEECVEWTMPSKVWPGNYYWQIKLDPDIDREEMIREIALHKSP